MLARRTHLEVAGLRLALQHVGPSSRVGSGVHNEAPGQTPWQRSLAKLGPEKGSEHLKGWDRIKKGW